MPLSEEGKKRSPPNFPKFLTCKIRYTASSWTPRPLHRVNHAAAPAPTSTCLNNYSSVSNCLPVPSPSQPPHPQPFPPSQNTPPPTSPTPSPLPSPPPPHPQWPPLPPPAPPSQPSNDVADPENVAQAAKPPARASSPSTMTLAVEAGDQEQGRLCRQ